MARTYRTPAGGGEGPYTFDTLIRLADGHELSSGRVRADTPTDAARQIERANSDFIRGQIKPPAIVVDGPFGRHAFPTDSTWRGRRRVDTKTATLFGGR
jgi:hypothetical protein